MRTALCLLLCLLASCVLFTQGLAHDAHYAPALGVPWVTIDAVFFPVIVYPPWRGMVWAWRWGQWTMLQWPLIFSGLVGFALVARYWRDTRQANRTNGARWSTGRELRRLGLFATHGVVLGAYRGQVVRHSNPAHTLVVASTQSGKSTGVIIPTLFDWPGSIIVHDPKGELEPITRGYRASMSTVMSLRATEAVSPSHYNPLDAIRLGTPYAYRDMHLIASMLSDPDGDGYRTEAAQHFGPLAEVVLVGLIEWGVTTGRAATLGGCHRTLAGSIDELLSALASTPASTLLTDMGDRERGALLSTARRGLALWADPLIDALTSTSDFRLDDLRNGARPLTLYCGIPFGDQERLVPLSRLLLRQWLDGAVQAGKRARYPLLAAIDELPALGRLPILAHILDYGAGEGVTALYCTPSLNRLLALYGPHQNFLEEARYCLIMGMNDPEVAQRFARYGGMTHPKRVRTSTTRSRQGRSTTSSEETDRVPLITDADLLHPPPQESLLLIGGAYPVRLRKRPYYTVRAYRHRAALKEPPHG